jgi:CheY-like chemotaxis protein
MPKILLVEDDNNLREIFDMRLQAEGYKTVTAGDGEEALVIAVKEKPDLVIADVMMPKLSGFEMVENMRAAPELANVKVVMMTALGQAEDRARGEKLGVVKYLVKSQVTLEDFVRVIRDVMPPEGGGAAPAESQPDNAAEQNNISNQSESETSMPPQDNQAQPTNPAPDAGAAPAADPAANPISGTPAAPLGDAPAGDQQTTAEETSAVQDQINNFETDPAAGAAPAAPATDAPAPDTTSVPSAEAPAPADPNSPAVGQAPEAPAPDAGAAPETPAEPPANNAL